MLVLFISRTKCYKEGGFVTPCPERVYGMCNRMCTKGFLNYFSAIIEFLKIVLRVKL